MLLKCVNLKVLILGGRCGDRNGKNEGDGGSTSLNMFAAMSWTKY